MSESDHLSKLAKIQAHCRSMHVRNEMQKVKAVYEEIFNEIEGNESDTCIVWSNSALSNSVLSPNGSVSNRSNLTSQEENTSICYPKFVSRKSLGRSGTMGSVAQTAQKDADVPKNINQTYCVKKDEAKDKENYGELGIDTSRLSFLEYENLKTLNKEELIKTRESVSLELLWIEQAIESRKHVRIVSACSSHSSVHVLTL